MNVERLGAICIGIALLYCGVGCQSLEEDEESKNGYFGEPVKGDEPDDGLLDEGVLFDAGPPSTFIPDEGPIDARMKEDLDMGCQLLCDQLYIPSVLVLLKSEQFYVEGESPNHEGYNYFGPRTLSFVSGSGEVVSVDCNADTIFPNQGTYEHACVIDPPRGMTEITISVPRQGSTTRQVTLAECKCHPQALIELTLPLSQ